MMDMNYKGTVMHIGAAPAEKQIYCYSTSDEAQEKPVLGICVGILARMTRAFLQAGFRTPEKSWRMMRTRFSAQSLIM